MERGFVLIFILCFISHSTGLNLSFDLRGSSPSGRRSPCGVLSCVESYVSSDSSPDQNHTTTGSSSRTITGMDIFTVRSTSPDSGDGETRQLLASLTSQQSTITRVSNGMKIEGHLEASKATLLLEIFKVNDCSAEFVCEVVSLDAHGNQVMNSNRLRQQQIQVEDQSKDTSQFMMFVEQLELLENRLEDKVENRLSQLENTLEDKMRVLFEGKMETHVAQLEQKVEKSSNTSFVILEQYLSQLQALENSEQTDFNSLSLVIDELSNNISNYFDHQISADASIQDTLLREIQSLDLNTCNSSTEMLSSLHHQISETNSLISNNFKPVSDLLKPKRCKRGLVSLPVQTPFPYTVIRPNKESVLNVSYLCDEITDGGGWIVIQRRTSGDVDFYRDWATYKKGFGSLATEFWLGNDNLHALTSSGNYELQVDLKYNGKSAFAHYDTFSVDGEENNYALTVGGYAGTAGDSLTYHNGTAFSTFDKDNDEDSRHCAALFTGAWWYKGCHYSNLNGRWGERDDKGPEWHTFSNNEPLSYSEMKIRLVDVS